ncbi:MAG: FG-GAP repeat domain-containing protein [Verrucomicrobiales bacterium]
MPTQLDDHRWHSEHLNESAGHRLKELASLLSRPASEWPEAANALLAPGFRTTRLRPAALGKTEVPPLTVQRLQAPVHDPVEADAATFALHLRELFASAPDPSDVSALFKIFRVSTEPAETTVRFELVAGNAATRFQSVAQWRCRWLPQEQGDPFLASIIVEEFEETTAPTPRTFADCTGSLLGHDTAFTSQLAHSLDHWVARIEQSYTFGPSGWEGIALGDANGDGRDDIYVCQPGGLPNRLFLQNADGTLTDGAREAGVDWWDQSQASLFCDFDNDGDQDLAVSMIWGVLFLANNGTGKFAPAASKLTAEGMPYSLAAADYDADGDLDLYVCCYAKRGTAVDQRFLARPLPYHDANNGSRNLLLRNDRQFRFRDVTTQTGLGENNARFSFAAAWEDYDSDGDLDLYVANDFGRNNLYRCDRTPDGTRFRDVAAIAGVEDISAGMSASWGDVDNDGNPDIYVSNMWSSAGNRVSYQRRFREGSSQLTSFQRHARGNSLFHNAGDGTFHDISESAGVTMGRWAWGSRFADLNNDGHDDLVVANGYITQPDPADL